MVKNDFTHPQLLNIVKECHLTCKMFGQKIEHVV
jgi:hypothetical protein